jgi:hypothetical protein
VTRNETIENLLSRKMPVPKTRTAALLWAQKAREDAITALQQLEDENQVKSEDVRFARDLLRVLILRCNRVISENK